MTGGLHALCSTDHDHVWKSGTYYPYSHLVRYGRGVSLQTAVDCETFDIPSYFIDDGTQYQRREGIPFLDTAAAVDENAGELNIFVINRKWDGDMSVDIDVSGFEGWKFVEHIQMYSDDLSARNSYDDPNVLLPTINKDTTFDNGKLSTNMKRLSWNVFRFTK
jgi:alpha-N-arabinofuranosidase